MILFYRVTPFLVAIASALGFAAFILRDAHPLTALGVAGIVLIFLFARVLQFQWGAFSFWFFLGTAALFFLSASAMLLLLEPVSFQITVAAVTTVFLTLFSEFIFLYVHLPSTYQPFSLEYLTLLLNLLSIFFLSSFGFASRLLVETPLWLLAPIFFLLGFFLIYGMLWVSKAERHALTYALVGAVLFVEFFIAVAYLPTGFYSNAAFLTIFSYVFFGLTRAQAIHKLSKEVMRRYLLTACFLFFVISVSSQWL